MLTLLINNFNQDMLDRVKQSLGRRTDLGKHQLQTIDLSFIHKQHYREFNMEKKTKSIKTAFEMLKQTQNL